MSQEDELAAAMIEQKQAEGFNCYVEQHYNHYGTRGVVDLVLEHDNHVELCELKSDAAIKEATGANEIIRQAKRHAEYYFKDKSHPGVAAKFNRIYFYITAQSLNHVRENIGLYEAFMNQSIDGCANGVRFAHPDSRTFINATKLITADGADEEYLSEMLNADAKTPLDAATRLPEWLTEGDA